MSIRLIFLGPPGAGKGTQATALARDCGVPHISTGDILRSAVAHQTDLGIKAQSYMDRGDLVPDDLMLDLVRDRLTQSDAINGWILDGFPRTTIQAAFLESLLSDINQSCDRVVNLDVPDDVLTTRLLNRGRSDDTEETIRNRLKVYRESTAPLIDFYQERQKLTSVNGNQPVDQVTEQLKHLV